MRNLLKAEGIKLTVVDDKADYMGRIKALKSGDAHMALFPLNSFIQAGSQFGEFPATIVYIVDETKGADAIVSYKQGISTIQDLDCDKGRVVYTSDSPSEFLAEITLASFSMPRLSKDWRVKVGGSEEAYRDMLASKKTDKKAWVLWEPQVSMALENPDAIDLINSSKMKGFILDGFAVNRKFLQEHANIVDSVIEAYAKVLYSFAQGDRMAELICSDAGAEAALVRRHVARMTNGIQWKNVMENYAYFGLDPNAGSESMEDIILKVTKVMVQTGMIKEDPLKGNPNLIYYDGVLRRMKGNNFHPGQKINVLSGVDLGIKDEVVRSSVALKALTPDEWKKLVSVGNFQVEPIQFPRNSSEITPNSKRMLKELSQRLKDWPSYYVTVIGQARGTGDSEIDTMSTELATKRAEAVISELVSLGVTKERFCAKANLSTSNDWSGLNLLFSAGQLPY
jgi:hypothetical protein